MRASVRDFGNSDLRERDVQLGASVRDGNSSPNHNLKNLKSFKLISEDH